MAQLLFNLLHVKVCRNARLLLLYLLPQLQVRNVLLSYRLQQVCDPFRPSAHLAAPVAVVHLVDYRLTSQLRVLLERLHQVVDILREGLRQLLYRLLVPLQALLLQSRLQLLRLQIRLVFLSPATYF